MAERKQSKRMQEQDDAVRQEQSGVEAGDTKQQEPFSIEETFARIDGLIAQLESPEIGLEQSFQAYEEGMKLLKACNDQIDRVEKKVLALSGDGGLDELGE